MIQKESNRFSDDILSEKQAAEILQISQRTMQDWRHNGQGPTFIALSTKSVRYRYGDLIDWLKSKKGAAPKKIERSQK